MTTPSGKRLLISEQGSRMRSQRLLIVGKQAISFGFAWESRPVLKLANDKLNINSDWVGHIGFNSSIWLYSAAMRIGDKAEWSTLLDEEEDET